MMEIKKCPNCYRYFREQDLKESDGIVECPICNEPLVKNDSGEYEILDD